MNCQKITKESQAEPETDNEATLGAEGGKANISNIIDNNEESRPLKKKWIEYTLKRDPPAPPRTMSILYQTVDPSKILATTTAFYQLTLTQGGVSNAQSVHSFT